ncbi:DNA-binding PucR family transcriptional regulator [Cytobacillus eiseniae]|uniref:DNA-binding PucR family transcriptional regulator n=1 Tax=Cytobacillus eiseniae TaxID=762947 RepID=A0ABS4RF37_9BACI|nr:helix-turn-helix domain-containing protein [Cytobacillus eiseniae]MBP2241520.1 DNA-binding PucR family transcriptional regulator [Cytobacillus eiseniae]
MLKRLQSYFPSSIVTETPPVSNDKRYYWFKDYNNPFWLGVLKSEIKKDQLELLSSLLERVNPNSPVHLTGSAKDWHAFLFHEHSFPLNSDTTIRFIQFQINKIDKDLTDVEEAIKEFFHHCLAFIWIDETNGIIIEEKSKTAYEENDFHSISATLESDFYIKSLFYIGKFRTGSVALRETFFLERELFVHAMNHPLKERILSFEKIFPTLLAFNLPKTSSKLLYNDVIQVLNEDPELRKTIEAYFEHHSNTSLASKKLYIHRNTLKYRLNQFSKKTNIDLNDFKSVFTVYLACLLAKDMD